MLFFVILLGCRDVGLSMNDVWSAGCSCSVLFLASILSGLMSGTSLKGIEENLESILQHLPLLGQTLNLFSTNTNQFSDKSMFALYGTWGPLDGCKILLRGVGTFCPPGKTIQTSQKFGLCLGCPSNARVVLGLFFHHPPFSLP